MIALLERWVQWLPTILAGLGNSMLLAGTALIVGLPLGLAAAVASSSVGRVPRLVLVGVMEFARGVPVLVLIYLAYFGLPSVGLTLESFSASVVAIAFSVCGFSSEIFRGGLSAVPSAQREAARAVGLSSFDQLRSVVLPQSLRHALPPLVSLAVQVVQLTSLAFAIGYPELMARANDIGVLGGSALDVYVLSAVVYACVLIPLVRLAARLTRVRDEANSPIPV